jgi:hypothetical protein
MSGATLLDLAYFPPSPMPFRMGGVPSEVVGYLRTSTAPSCVRGLDDTPERWCRTHSRRNLRDGADGPRCDCAAAMAHEPGTAWED